MKHVIRPVAKDDIARQFDYYLITKESPETALRFLKAVRDAITQLLALPECGAPKLLNAPALKGLRSWPVQGFEEIRIYYLIDVNVLRVIRVLHGRRDIPAILESEADG